MSDFSNDFYNKVYQVARLIPEGRVTSYGAISNYLGRKGGARVVGWAMNNSHTKNVPAHRVVNRNGVLTGKHHFDGVNLMKQLLENEGLEIINDKIKNFQFHFWDPSREL